VSQPSNVDLVRQGFQLFEQEGPAAVFRLADPEIEVHAAPGVEPTGTYRGYEDALRWAQEWFDAWDEFRMQPAEIVEVGDRFVVVTTHQSATGKGSGIEVEIDVSYLFEIRDGRVARFHLYRERVQALAAAERLAADD
jgi:ketosteroid isomerase-like protein